MGIIFKKEKICLNCNTRGFIWKNKLCKKCYYAIINKENENEDLIFYFKHHLNILNSKTHKCCNCDFPLYNPTTVNVAHILPKAIFKSVRSNINNVLYLCLNCHGSYDHSWKKAKDMKCFIEAKHKFNLFLKQNLTEEEKNNKMLIFFDEK